MRISEWAELHRGRPAAVLGGGPSLLKDMERLPPDCVLIGVNHHASMVVDCDYIFFKDYHAAELVKDLVGVKLSDERVDVSEMDVTFIPRIHNSGVAAAMIAHAMGCDPVILCGCDCYTEGVYFHHTDHMPAGVGLGMDYWHRRWGEAKRYAPSIVAMSGPLVDFLGGYNPMKKKKEKTKIKCRVLKRHNERLNEMDTMSLHAGVEGLFNNELAAKLIKAGILEECK